VAHHSRTSSSKRGEGYVELQKLDKDEDLAGSLAGTGEDCEQGLEPEDEDGARKEAARERGLQRIKYCVLCLLVVQNVSTILCIKQASLRKADDGHQALSTCIVVMVEVIKVVLCSLEIAVRKGGPAGLFQELHRDVVSQPRETGGLMVPCILYFVQNNLLLLSVANLDPPVYYVLSQLKILATALFSILILGSVISARKWLALILLVAGVCMSQSNANLSQASRVNLIGLGAATGGVFTSGLAGVLCERILKQRAPGSPKVAMTVRNIQLGVPGLLFGFASVYLQDMDKVTSDGFFQGFTGWTWAVVVLHSLGGLLVTAVMTFADNVLKGFAMAASLIFACLFSAKFYGFVLSANFALGAGLVVLATFMYLVDDNAFDWIFKFFTSNRAQTDARPEVRAVAERPPEETA
jgi:UDP-sugar transporter A1/2/3